VKKEEEELQEARKFLVEMAEDIEGSEPVVDEAIRAIRKADQTNDPEDVRLAQKAFARVAALVPTGKRDILFGILWLGGASIILLTLKKVIQNRRRKH